MNKGTHGYLHAAVSRSKGSSGQVWPEMGEISNMKGFQFSATCVGGLITMNMIFCKDFKVRKH